MEIQEIISKRKELYTSFLNLIESDDDLSNCLSFIDLCEQYKIKEKREELIFLINMIIKISENHYRTANFFDKIETVILNFKDEIKQAFSRYELYSLCKNNKRILIFFFKEKILEFDDTMLSDIKNILSPHSKINYLFFLNEVKSIETAKIIRKMEKELLQYEPIELNMFDEKRKIGENDFHISKLIREDSVEDFITYINHYNIKSTSKIKPSVFETNAFLVSKRETTLIQYSAFFGSIQIFRYLLMNNAELDESIWLYAIHSNNGELIHMIEEIGIKPDYEICMKESIKCHHNNIVNYFCDMYKNQNDRSDADMCKYSLANGNYFLIPDDMISMISKSRNKNEFNFQCLDSIVTKITIPSSVTTIGKDAFRGCSYLKEVIISSSVTTIESNAFIECESLEQVTIPSSVTSIGGGVFNGCKSLTEITIPSSVTSIKGGIFTNCTSLKKISILSPITSIEASFACGCNSLEQITIPSTVTSINNLAFKNCSSLTEIIIPSSVTSIEDYAFYGCTSLKNIIIPSSVTSIGEYAFFGCTSLTTIKIPPSIRSIGKLAFKECDNLRLSTIPSSITDLKWIGLKKKNLIL